MATQNDNTVLQPKTSALSPPNTASAPAMNRPSLCIKPMPSSSSSPPPTASATSPPVSLTSKEWVIPPRPKPGRKPATDTPPTKRKAQNRAAQRAFRERRAARVGELEEQIRQVEDENERQQDSLHSTIAELEKNLERYQADLATWMGKYRKIERELADAQAKLRQRNGDTAIEKSSEQHSDNARNPAEDEHQFGCGNCTIDSHCQCIDDVVEAMNGDIDATQLEKRASSPSTSNSNKRVKVEPKDSEEMEIDFTSAFARSSNASRAVVISPRSAMADPCGFCQDGTPCICAEMAAEQERRGTGTRPSSPVGSNHPNARQLAQFTPPPSDGDVGSGILSLTGGCGSRPGTCDQCRADPSSTLFCKSLAASRKQAGGPQGCCGSRGADGGCCQASVPLPSRATRSRTAATNNIVQLPPPNVKPSVTLTCADAYTALSRHAGYERASGEMASWMPKLHATPASTDGRPAMEIDAANVMAVLKDFDRRFGASK